MLISIIVPVYNVEKYLVQAMESILSQKKCELQIILINDGSTDSSLKIIQQYADRYSNIEVINQSNQGLSAARNAGLNVAKGQYVMFLDSDDWLVEGCVEDIVTNIKENAPDLLVYAGQKVYEKSKDLVRGELFGPGESKEFATGREAYEALRLTHTYSTCVVLQVIRRELLYEEKIRFYEGILHEDHLFTFQVLMAAKQVICVPVPYYQYRIRENSIMTREKQYDRHFRGFAITCMEMDKLLNKIGYSDNRIAQEHLNELATITTKYLIRMTKEEIQDESILVDAFLKWLKQQKERIPKYIYNACMCKLLICGRKY